MKKGAAKLIIVLFLSAYSSFAFSIDQAKVEQLTELMMVGCSLGQKVTISASGKGEISFLRKGVKGDFKASRSELPGIIEFLASDKMKGEQANETRGCIRHYMDKIFDAILGNEVSASPSDLMQTSAGVIYKLLKCERSGRNSITCNYKVTSTFQDRIVSIGGGTHYAGLLTRMYDDKNNQYSPANVSLANNPGKKGYGVYNITLVADTPADMQIVFSNISSRMKYISLIELGVSSALNKNRISEMLKFRNITI